MSTKSHAITHNFAILSIGQLASRFLAFIVTVNLTRVLLPDEYGAIVFATTVLLYAGIIVDFGFDSFGPLEVARGTVSVQSIVKTVLTLRLSFLVPAVIGLGIVTWLLPMPALTKMIIALYALSMLPSALDLNWVFLGSRIMLPAIVSDIACQALLALGVFLLVKQPSDAIYLPLIFLAARAVSVTYLIVTFVRRFGSIKLGYERPLIKRYISAALPLTGSAAVGRLVENFDILLIGLWVGSQATGLYGASFRIVWMLILLSVAYYTALRPVLAQAYVNGFHTIETLLSRTMRISTAIAIGVAVGGIIVARPLVQFLFGEAYLEAVRPFQILLVFFALHMVSRTYRVLLISFNRQANDLKIMSAAAVLNITLNLLMIRSFGMIGAAIANVLSETLILVLNYLTTRRFVGHVPLGRYIWKPVICSAVMGFVLISAHSMHVIIQIALGGGIYVAMLFALGVINADDLKNILKSGSTSKTVPQSSVPGAEKPPSANAFTAANIAE